VTFGDVQVLDPGGPLTRQALRNGEIDVALLFTTDPAIEGEGLVELIDDRNLQPAENVTPFIRSEVVERWGDDVVGVIDRVSRVLTTAAVRELNAAASGEPGSDDAASVAAAWLLSVGAT
jgi:osmoprotectant transport system substrate-binding protein